MKKILYVMDPLCGWCYGNCNNITEIYNQFKDSITFELVLGGMWLYDNAPVGGEGLHQFIVNHSPQMVNLTGAEVSSKYFGLASDNSYTFSSLEPCAAIATVKKINPEKTFLFAKDVQKAMFVDGKKLDELNTYLPILDELSINSSEFNNNWLPEENISNTEKDFARSNALVSGFPALIYQLDNQAYMLASGYFKKETVRDTIQELLT